VIPAASTGEGLAPESSVIELLSGGCRLKIFPATYSEAIRTDGAPGPEPRRRWILLAMRDKKLTPPAMMETK
jgi:hypothetical protein